MIVDLLLNPDHGQHHQNPKSLTANEYSLIFSHPLHRVNDKWFLLLWLIFAQIIIALLNFLIMRSFILEGEILAAEQEPDEISLYSCVWFIVVE